MNLFLFEITPNHRSIGERSGAGVKDLPGSSSLEQDFRHQVSNNQVFELCARLLSPLFLGFVFLSPLVHLLQA
jgi:hypothetical protein